MNIHSNINLFIHLFSSTAIFFIEIMKIDIAANFIAERPFKAS